MTYAYFFERIAGVVFSGIDSYKGRKRSKVSKTDDISNLGHELGAKGRINPIRCHDNGIFQKCSSSHIQFLDGETQLFPMLCSPL